MIRTCKYRIYPTRAQVTKLEHVLDICCELYNAALQERRDAWRIARKSISYYDQQNQLPELRQIRSDLKGIHSQVLRDPLVRLDKAFDAFFRRVRAGEKAVGFPRFRSRSRYNSFSYPQSGFTIDHGKLKLSKIGKVKIKLHRSIEGGIKTLTITRASTGKWFACFTVEINPQAMPLESLAVGIDCGLEKFATLSTGEQVENPRFLRTEERQLAKAQRKLSAAKKGSPKRAKSRKVVVRIHERIANKRRNFAHQESRKLVNRFGIVVFEDLNIRGMLKNHCLAKSIADAGWKQFVQFTSYKAENAGRCVVRVNPYNTSKTCSRCGEIVVITLKERIFHCPSCGLNIDRDENASINIKSLGLQALGISPKSRAYHGAE